MRTEKIEPQALLIPIVINNPVTPIQYVKKDGVRKIKEIYKTYDRRGRERYVYPPGQFIDVIA